MSVHDSHRGGPGSSGSSRRHSSRPSVFRDAWGGRWLGFDLSQVEEVEVLELLQDAWLSVAPKALAASYERAGNERSQNSR